MRVLFWYGLTLQIASVTSEHSGKRNGGPNQWVIRVKITPLLLKIRPSLFDNSSRASADDV